MDDVGATRLSSSTWRDGAFCLFNSICDELTAPSVLPLDFFDLDLLVFAAVAVVEPVGAAMSALVRLLKAPAFDDDAINDVPVSAAIDPGVALGGDTDGC